jgi:RNA polymerase-binding transcription factor DksA
MGDTTGIKNRLSERYQTLLSRLSKIENDRRHRTHALSPDWADAAIERENDEVLDRLAESTAQEVAGVRRALDRIEAGQYGICERCQHAIAPPRLRAIPHATLCADCVRQQVAS